MATFIAELSPVYCSTYQRMEHSGYLVHSCVTHGQAAKDRRERNGVLEECPFPVITFLTSLLFFYQLRNDKEGA